jgi:alkanesulfonate monooxygenase SsuD/methylene tetrahydromethanopterin reductase-like flavin-dependent oxidoreductase (luciferase family)
VLTEWAKRAEAEGFSTLGTIGRLVYPSYEELIALAAAAAVTERIRLTTSVAARSLRKNTALFAKQAASLDRRGHGVNGTDPIGPPPARHGGPELIIGGQGEAAFRRTARVGRPISGTGARERGCAKRS